MMNEIAPRTPVQVWIRLLGRVTVYVDGRKVDLGSKRERSLFVALVLALGEQVPRNRLAEWLWADPPAKLAEGLYEVAGDLRRRLAVVGLGERLVSKQGWYRLEIDPHWVDLHQFTTMVNRAPALDDESRRDMLADALKLCDGEPLAGLDGRQIDSFRARLNNQIRDIEIMISQIDLRHGRHREWISDLDRLFHTEPEDMRAAGLYMYALHQTGRTLDALAVFTTHRNRLVAVGMDVSQQLEDLHVRLLRNETNLSPAADAFLGGRPASPGCPAESDSTAGETNTPETDPGSGTGTGTRASVHFNAPVNAGDHAVFGIGSVS